MTRPVGIVLLIAALLWHLLSGLATAGIVVTRLFGQHMALPLSATAIVAILVVAPLAAGIAAAGLWLGRRWAVTAFAIWGALLLLETATLLWVMTNVTGLVTHGWLLAGFVLVVLALGVVAAVAYVYYVMRMPPEDR